MSANKCPAHELLLEALGSTRSLAGRTVSDFSMGQTANITCWYIHWREKVAKWAEEQGYE